MWTRERRRCTPRALDLMRELLGHAEDGKVRAPYGIARSLGFGRKDVESLVRAGALLPGKRLRGRAREYAIRDIVLYDSQGRELDLRGGALRQAQAKAGPAEDLLKAAARLVLNDAGIKDKGQIRRAQEQLKRDAAALRQHIERLQGQVATMEALAEQLERIVANYELLEAVLEAQAQRQAQAQAQAQEQAQGQEQAREQAPQAQGQGQAQEQTQELD